MKGTKQKSSVPVKSSSSKTGTTASTTGARTTGTASKYND